ncbi:class D beta-lactamase [Rhodanobacter glycinis]|uniref:beta-lactamase n=1 Tax=Rhodanobacter glycinis TaxID=582702 RepID=A0A502FBR9_9GAMM|nr:class D beta-lactamase [Rhodanobacter glycinis]TPG11420.1 class D beta-lactamase [Rhodanobacter glycinis]TPG46837.1 class D beta-lactamase [Rhodanobacter glycinis]
MIRRSPSWLFFALIAFSSLGHSTSWRDHPQWQSSFARAGVKGTLLVYDEKADVWHVSDAARSRQAFLPASTFKLFNALVALDSGAVKDEFEVIRWDGKVRGLKDSPVAEWNRDNSLASGMRYSTVWFYQEVARRAGEQRMQQWIDKAGYGNRDISGGIDTFWLNGALRISAEQQIDFLRRLADDKLPFSPRAQEIVRRISITESAPAYVLHAKTGWGTQAAQNKTNDDLGWYVGWVEHAGRRWFFAMNIDLPAPDDAAKRMPLTKQLLTQLGALPQGN